MSNSYITVPNIIPGKLTVGGDLDVKGEVRIGAFTPRLRLRMNDTTYAYIGYNASGDGTVRDDGSRGSSMLTLGPPASQFNAYMQNTANGPQSAGLVQVFAADYTAHAHTGDTAEFTLYSKTISAGMMGPDGGLRVKLGIQLAAGAPNSTLRIKLGGTTIDSENLGAATLYAYELHFLNRHNNGSQFYEAVKAWGSNSLLVTTGTSAINTAVDNTLAITIQNAAAGDTATLNWIHVSLINSFGPV